MNTGNLTRSQSRSQSVAIGVVLLLAGLLAMVLPFLTAIAASILFGCLVLFGGATHLMYAWMERDAASVLWQLLIGIVYLVAGTSLLLSPITGAVTLTLVLGLYIAIEGILELVLYLRLRGGPRAVWYLVDGLTSVVLAGMILLHWPSSSVWALGTLVGVSLVFSGIARLAMPVGHRSAMP